ncbi:MAG: CDP-paratose 2-epimerase [Myxococcota bacterium]
MVYTIRTDVTLGRSLDDTFDFFSDASNLEAITPPELRFSIKTPLPIEMKQGALIEYSLSLYGVPFSWLTEISVWEPGVRFIDQQIAGPFKVWHHEHCFESLGADKSRIRDQVRYVLPFEPFGKIAHPLVRTKLDRIFSYRTDKVREVMDGGPKAV